MSSNRALVVCLPVAVLFGLNDISWAALTLKSWNTGDTLTAAELNANFAAVKTEMELLSGEATPWTNATLGTGWTNYGGATYGPAQYRRLGNLVYLRGLITSGSATYDMVAATVLTLPVGYRPLKAEIFAQDSGGAAHCRVDVRATGEVSVQYSGLTTHSGYLSLSGIVFSVD
jgi:hypothetical protein